MGRSWIEVRVEAPALLVEGLANFLIELGSPGIAQEPVRGGAGARKERLIAYFPPGPSFPERKRKIRRYLSALGGPLFPFSLQCRPLPEERWAEAWKSHFKPIRATPSLVVKPPWEDYRPGKGERVVEIDPGMAFGTGTHSTTQMCLQSLEELIPSFPRPPSVLDVGTGSGILAVAARKLGAGQVLAVDIDPQAIECAEKNAAANGVEGEIEFRPGSLSGIGRVFRIVVANLLPQEILKIAPALPARVASGGFLVISGILRRQRREILSAFPGEWTEALPAKSRKGWVCLTLRNQRGEERGKERGVASGAKPARVRRR